LTTPESPNLGRGGRSGCSVKKGRSENTIQRKKRGPLGNRKGKGVQICKESRPMRRRQAMEENRKIIVVQKKRGGGFFIERGSPNSIICNEEQD